MAAQAVAGTESAAAPPPSPDLDLLTKRQIMKAPLDEEAIRDVLLMNAMNLNGRFRDQVRNTYR